MVHSVKRHWHVDEIASGRLAKEDIALVKNVGRPGMEIIVKKDDKMTRHTSEQGAGSGKGQRIGVAYRGWKAARPSNVPRTGKTH